ncbi:MAG: OadG family protein [Ruminococcus sp.]|nr:OadG family protein [Ruminococcus sp.]
MFDSVMTMSAEVAEETTKAASDISIADAAVTAVFGYTVVFVGILILMIVIYIVGAYFKSKDAKAKQNAADTAKTAAPAAAPEATKPVAPGSAGHIKLFDVPDKEAAMIMAIVADKMQKPLNELHFISIKEVK